MIYKIFSCVQNKLLSAIILVNMLSYVGIHATSAISQESINQHKERITKELRTNNYKRSIGLGMCVVGIGALVYSYCKPRISNYISFFDKKTEDISYASQSDIEELRKKIEQLGQIIMPPKVSFLSKAWIVTTASRIFDMTVQFSSAQMLWLSAIHLQKTIFHAGDIPWFIESHTQMASMTEQLKEIGRIVSRGSHVTLYERKYVAGLIPAIRSHMIDSMTQLVSFLSYKSDLYAQEELIELRNEIITVAHYLVDRTDDFLILLDVVAQNAATITDEFVATYNQKSFLMHVDQFDHDIKSNIAYCSALEHSVI